MLRRQILKGRLVEPSLLPLVIAGSGIALVLIGATTARFGFRRNKKATDK
jgi:hypothetical protein